MPVAVGVAAVARGVHHPTDRHGQQHERDESTDQRPVHAVNIYEAGQMPSRSVAPDAERREPPTRSGVQRDLLGGRRKRPRDLQPSLLAEHEPQLARRAQSVGMRRTKGRAGSGPGYGAEEILMKEAVFAARFCRCGATVRHARPTPRSDLKDNCNAQP